MAQFLKNQTPSATGNCKPTSKDGKAIQAFVRKLFDGTDYLQDKQALPFLLSKEGSLSKDEQRALCGNLALFIHENTKNSINGFRADQHKALGTVNFYSGPRATAEDRLVCSYTLNLAYEVLSFNYQPTASSPSARTHLMLSSYGGIDGILDQVRGFLGDPGAFMAKNKLPTPPELEERMEKFNKKIEEFKKLPYVASILKQ